MKNRRVEIVTPVHNRRELTLQCLKSLSRLDCTNLTVHIIVVDDGSTDETSEAIRESFPAVEIIEGDGSLWYTAGMNRGIQAALRYNPDYILGINDDSIFDEQCLQNLIECAEKHPRSVVGALLLLWDVPHKVFQVSPQWKTLEGGWKYWQNQTIWTIPEKPWKVEVIVGNCVLFPVAVFGEVGLLDAGKSAQYGDAEFTRRILKKGWNLLIEPRARVFCQPNYALTKVLEMPLRKQINLLFFNRKNGNNLIHRFYFLLSTAPTKPQGLAAFGIFYLRWVGRRLSGGSNALKQEENKLSETFADAVVKD